MNAQDRKELQQLMEQASDIASRLEEMAGTQQEKADNLEEYWPGSEKAERAASQAEALDTAMSTAQQLQEEMEQAMEA